MRYLIFVLVLIGTTMNLSAQVGEKVSEVKVLNVKNNSVELPMLGEKNLLIFYQDPTHSEENSNLQDYLKSHPITGSGVVSYGVVNMAAAPLIPNGLIKRMARKRVKGTDAQVFFDPDNALSRGWKLGDVNNASCVIAVGKDRVIQFFKAGQVTDTEMQQVIDWVREHQ